MEALPCATLAEEKDMPNWICTFFNWMMTQGRKEGTAKTYASAMRTLFEEDGKGPAIMASPAYFELTKSSYKNKIGNSIRSSALSCFQQFYPVFVASGAKLEDASTSGMALCSIRGRAFGKERQERIEADLAESQETPEATKLRATLKLPADWKVAVRARSTGHLYVAVSPGGRAYTTRESVQERIANGDQDTKPAPPAEPVCAPPVALPTSLVRRTLPLDKALAAALYAPWMDGSAAKGDQKARRALLVSGMDESRDLARRLHGLYVEQAPGGRVFRKADHSLNTLLVFGEQRGVWRFALSLDGIAELARAKDPADAPWKVAATWEVFDGTAAYEAEPGLKVDLLDTDALPDMDMEVCLPMPKWTGSGSSKLKTPPAKKARRSAAGGGAGGVEAPSAEKQAA